MKHFFKLCLKSIWTTLIGTITGLPTLVTGIETKDPNSILLGAGMIVTGILAKDANQ